MERRSFLRGLLVSATATTAGADALVRLAKPSEIAELVPAQEVILGHPIPQHEFYWPGDPEVYVRRKDKGFVCVGVLRHMTVQQDHIDVSLRWSGRFNSFQA